MKIGVSFNINQTFDTNCLFTTLKCLKEESFNWHIIDNQTEVWANSDGKDFFLKKEYNSEEFFELISDKHYAVFVKIQAYFVSSYFHEVHTKEEFKKSECKIIVLICDSFWGDIYIKDISLIDNVYQSLLKSDFDNVKYIYDNDDMRTKFDVL